MKLFVTLLNKLPAVRRLRGEIAAAQAKLEVANTQLAHERGLHNGSLHRESELRDSLSHVKEKRNALQREFDDLREHFVRQSASVEILTKDRERAQVLNNELKLQLGEDKQREERFVRTIDTLNETLRARNAELEDVRQELTEAQEEIARRQRPVLFRREGEFSEEEIAEILAGHGSDRRVKALLQVLDECAVEAMSEAAGAPLPHIAGGPQAGRGFSAEDRTFSSGGVFALTELKRRLVERLHPQPAAQERAAA